MTLAPRSILEIEYQNPAPSADWSASAGGGNAFPLNRDYEWDQVVAPGEEYDESPVGTSGWIINPKISKSDLPMSHPFLKRNSAGDIDGDWEFKIALDDQKNEYLCSIANSVLEDGQTADPDVVHAVNDLKVNDPSIGAAVHNGLLGVEIDQSLVPQGFRGRVNEGDRVAVFGRWIVDQAHVTKILDAYRTEIHPPLVLATGSVQQDTAGAQFTRVLFMSRPYLVGQKYTTDPNNAYDDTAGDDGAFKGHLINELVKVLSPIPLSFKVQFHPKIKSHPFLGPHLLHFIVRPPSIPRHLPGEVQAFQMAVSFNFTVRKGCAIQVVSPVTGQVDVLIALNNLGYTPPKLPTRTDQNWGRGDLNQVYPGSGDLASNVADVSGGLLAVLLGGPLNLAKVEAVVESGVITDIYDPVPEVNILDTSGAVVNVAADRIPPGQGITVNDSDDQPFPVFGWLEAKWVRPSILHQ